MSISTTLNLEKYLDLLISTLEKLSPSWFAKHSTSVYDIIALVAGTIENLSANKSYLESEDKLFLALQFLPIAVNQLVRMGYIPQNVAPTIKNFLANTETVTSIINLLISIANQPNFLQASTWVKSKGTTC